jgi:lactoylglutathione lyase
MQYLHTMIRVGDLDRTLEFFCDGLGFVEIRRSEHEAGRFTLVYLAAPQDAERARREDAPLVELTHNWDETEYSGGRNFGHLAFAVDDIYALCARLAAKGFTINRPPRDGRMAFIRTPDGVSLEFLQKGAALAPQEPWLSAPNIGSW